MKSTSSVENKIRTFLIMFSFLTLHRNRKCIPDSIWPHETNSYTKIA